MKTIAKPAMFVGLMALSMLTSGSLNSQTSDADGKPPPPDGRVIQAAKLALQDIPVEVLAPGISRQVIHGTQSTFSRWQLKAGTSIPLHHHVNEQMTWIISGRAEVVSGGTSYALGAGEIIVFAPNVEHAFTILEDTVAVDIFAPARQDWIDAAAGAVAQ